ncbi:MAG: sporulation protein [Saprospiraceae bacterium]|nr:sporulation protein [Saprospiraceae bacterium]
MKTGNYEEVLSKVTEFLKDETKTSTVIGTEFKLGEFTCVPVIKVGMGFGYGGGEGEAKISGHGEGSGAGAGMGIVPMGFLVSRGDLIQFVPANTTHGLSAAVEKLPDLLGKYLTNKKELQTQEPVLS